MLNLLKRLVDRTAQPPQQLPQQIQQTQHQPPQQIQQQPQQPLCQPSPSNDKTQLAAPQTCQQTPHTPHQPVYYWQPHFSQQQQSTVPIYLSTHSTLLRAVCPGSLSWIIDAGAGRAIIQDRLPGQSTISEFHHSDNPD